MNYEALSAMLINDEGLRLKPYTDTVGKLTIGVGRNLTDVGISRDEAMTLLQNDVNVATGDLDKTLPWWRTMNEVRQHVLINMCFNIGIVGLMGFKKALAAMEARDYDQAATEMEDSEWYTQVGGRGPRLVSLMRNGE
jgi:lysozyme